MQWGGQQGGLKIVQWGGWWVGWATEGSKNYAMGWFVGWGGQQGGVRVGG